MILLDFRMHRASVRCRPGCHRGVVLTVSKFVRLTAASMVSIVAFAVTARVGIVDELIRMFLELRFAVHAAEMISRSEMVHRSGSVRRVDDHSANGVGDEIGGLCWCECLVCVRHDLFFVDVSVIGIHCEA